MQGLEALSSSPLGGIAVALGIGLLIGVDRERNKGSGPERGAAGVRTFALVALLGAISALLESTILLAVLGIGVAALAYASYMPARTRDPGLTTEVTLVLVYALGVLAMRRPDIAAGVGVLAALLLVSRSPMHEFAKRKLSDQEVFDGILLAAAALIVLPLLPDRALDPYGVVNPQLIGRLTVLVLTLNAFGYIALRALGANIGLPVAGFFGGFVSSVATIGTLGQRARADDALSRPAIAGAALSSVATVIQLALVLAVVNRELLGHLSSGLILMGSAAAAYGGVFAYLAARRSQKTDAIPGRAFQLRFAIFFAVTITAMLLAAAFLADRFGSAGATLGVALAGLGDAHSASASAARLSATGALDERGAIIAILLAVATNSVTKVGVAWKAGGGAYAVALAPGIALMLAAFAVGALPD